MWLELFGAASSLLYIFLEINQRKSLWTVGFISSAVYAVVYFQEGWYAFSILYVYYVVASVYGLYCWHFAQKKNDTLTTERPVIRLTLRLCVILTITSMILFAAIWYVLNIFTDLTTLPPFCEALATSLSIVATWMLSQKILEQWFVWIFVNFFSAALCFMYGLYPTGILFLVYGIMSVTGWMKWKTVKN